MKDKSTTYSKTVIEIADYIFANPDKKPRDIVSVFVGKCRKSERTVERNIKRAKEYNQKRTSVQTPHKESAGRPTTYKSEYNEQVFKFCLLGATDKQIADFFGIAESTLNKWKNEHYEFSESIKRGKCVADANVASSLYSRAKGFVKNDCEKIFQNRGEIVRAKYTEYFPPDTTAAIFWLKNRQQKSWRDRQELTGMDGKDLIPQMNFDDFTNDELITYYKLLAKSNGKQSV